MEREPEQALLAAGRDLAEMSRNGVGSRTPFLMTRILPVCSTTKSRPDPSWALVTKTGESNPEATGTSVTDAPLAPVGPSARPGGRASDDAGDPAGGGAVGLHRSMMG